MTAKTEKRGGDVKTKNAKSLTTAAPSAKNGSPAEPALKTASDIMKILNDKIKESLIEVALIDPSPTNPRRTFDEAEIDELATSIGTKGLFQAILVRPKNGRFEVIYGERRWRATRKAGIARIRAGIAELSDEEVLEAQIHENLHRADIHPLEEAETYDYYLNHIKIDGKLLTEEQLATKLSKTTRYVVRQRALNQLFVEAKTDFRQGILPPKVAFELAQYPADVQESAYAKYVFETSWENGERRFNKQKPLSVRSLKDSIQSHILLDLKRAPFSLEAEDLHPERGSCLKCVERTGASILFAEMAEDDFCMNRRCYELKKENHVQIRRRRIAEETLVEKVKIEYKEKIVATTGRAEIIADATKRFLKKTVAATNELEDGSRESR